MNADRQHAHAQLVSVPFQVPELRSKSFTGQGRLAEDAPHGALPEVRCGERLSPRMLGTVSFTPDSTGQGNGSSPFRSTIVSTMRRLHPGRGRIPPHLPRGRPCGGQSR